MKSSTCKHVAVDYKQATLSNILCSLWSLGGERRDEINRSQPELKRSNLRKQTDVISWTDQNFLKTIVKVLSLSHILSFQLPPPLTHCTPHPLFLNPPLQKLLWNDAIDEEPHAPLWINMRCHNLCSFFQSTQLWLSLISKVCISSCCSLLKF